MSVIETVYKKIVSSTVFFVITQTFCTGIYLNYLILQFPFIDVGVHFDYNRKRKIIEFFVSHFINMAKTCLQYQAYYLALMYLNHSNILTMVWAQLPGGEIEVPKWKIKIKDARELCERELKQITPPAIPTRLTSGFQFNEATESAENVKIVQENTDVKPHSILKQTHRKNSEEEVVPVKEVQVQVEVHEEPKEGQEKVEGLPKLDNMGTKIVVEPKEEVSSAENVEQVEEKEEIKQSKEEPVIEKVQPKKDINEETMATNKDKPELTLNPVSSSNAPDRDIPFLLRKTEINKKTKQVLDVDVSSSLLLKTIKTNTKKVAIVEEKPETKNDFLEELHVPQNGEALQNGVGEKGDIELKPVKENILIHKTVQFQFVDDEIDLDSTTDL